MSPDRRRAILQAAALLAAGVLPACDSGGAPRREERKSMKTDLPVIYLPHGGGPWPYMKEPVPGSPRAYDAMTTYLRGIGTLGAARPSALLVVSAHWEEAVPTLMTSSRPPMLYDYSGFPPETYSVKWPAPGAPDLVVEVRTLLEKAGFRTAEDPRRGFDHGTFVPLALAFPEASVPTLQLSLVRGLDPALHVKLGQALAPLRKSGVLVVGSGMSYHNLRAFFGRAGKPPLDDSRAFDDWLEASMTARADRRHQHLVEWEKAPAARACHPREEHLLPLHVVAGAAGDAAGTLPYRDELMGARISAVHFG